MIVGLRGVRSSGLIDFLARCPELAETVVEANGLSSPAMSELMREARALLMPSFTEGYGLPIIEALALGTPVIASDIPAHREVGGAFATYLDPLDGIGWLSEIAARATESAVRNQARRTELAHCRTRTWSDYFNDIGPFLNAL